MSIMRVPVVTILLSALVVIAALAGAVVVIVEPQTLSFEHYLTDVVGLAASLGLLGIGRGIHLHGEAQADASLNTAITAISAAVAAPGRSEGVKAARFEPPPDPAS